MSLLYTWYRKCHLETSQTGLLQKIEDCLAIRNRNFDTGMPNQVNHCGKL